MHKCAQLCTSPWTPCFDRRDWVDGLVRTPNRNGAPTRHEDECYAFSPHPHISSVLGTWSRSQTPSRPFWWGVDRLERGGVFKTWLPTGWTSSYLYFRFSLNGTLVAGNRTCSLPQVLFVCHSVETRDAFLVWSVSVQSFATILTGPKLNLR